MSFGFIRSADGVPYFAFQARKQLSGIVITFACIFSFLYYVTIIFILFRPEKLLLIHEESERFTTLHHEYKNSNDLADNVCRYDLDDLDVAWLEKYNEERVDMGMSEFMSLAALLVSCL